MHVGRRWRVWPLPQDDGDDGDDGDVRASPNDRNLFTRVDIAFYDYRYRLSTCIREMYAHTHTHSPIHAHTYTTARVPFYMG